ncbi:MAG: hypothetical protein JW885_04645 [Deltaproteobacteria bacterium]|nr:hypothetical protein [Candidatus Zymogenaceae bacterium]
MKKVNCWEFEKCGREPGGEHAGDMGVCPAATNGSGSNGGLHAGRSCWIVAGTYCRGKVQGRFAQKLPECMQCDFYQLVKKEEAADFSLR